MSKRALIIGAGAVGSYAGEQVVRMGMSADFLDYDQFTADNAVKHSAIVRSPEDVGRNKAECLAERVKPLLEEGCFSNGIDTNLITIGPEALSGYDYVILAVDNYAAKVLFNEIWMSLPPERRPIAQMAGTYGESAQSVMTDGRDFCLRCLISEDWLIDPNLKTSCTGPQPRAEDRNGKIIRTSGMASSIAAHLIVDQIRAHVLGYPDVVNRRLTYTAYPNPGITVEKPLRKRGCPGCDIHPPSEIRWLDGCTLDMTLGTFLEAVIEDLKSDDIEVLVHRLMYKNVAHSAFIVSDVCHHCGRPIRVMKHEGRFLLNDLLCESCRSKGHIARFDSGFLPGEAFHAFTERTDREVKAMTLFDLGYPLGAHIYVNERNGAFDVLDSGKIRTRVYTLRDDPQRMHTVSKL